MTSPRNYRLYTFVANHYLSPLQCGLQTAHVVSELSRFKWNTAQRDIFDTWAQDDKTIIICGAGNHAGVVECWAELERINSALDLPAAIFREDEQSMNGMATACGVVVPQEYWDVVFFEPDIPRDVYGIDDRVKPAFWKHVDAYGQATQYYITHPEGQFISHIKKYRLA